MSRRTEYDTEAGLPVTEADAVGRLAQLANEPVKADAGEVATLVVPTEASVEKLDFEYLLDAPRRTRGVVQPQTVDDLVKYVQRHDDQGTTTIWVDLDARRVTALLNDHAADSAGWGDHTKLFPYGADAGSQTSGARVFVGTPRS